MSDSELETTLIHSFRAAGYGIAPPAASAGFSFVIGATFADKTVWVLKPNATTQLTIATDRTDTESTMKNSLADETWHQMIYEIALELGRFGAYVNFRFDPLTMTIYDNVSVDMHSRVSDVVDKANFVNRADTLAVLIAGKHTAASRFAGSGTVDEISVAARPSTTDELLDRIRASTAAVAAAAAATVAAQEGRTKA